MGPCRSNWLNWGQTGIKGSEIQWLVPMEEDHVQTYAQEKNEGFSPVNQECQGFRALGERKYYQPTFHFGLQASRTEQIIVSKHLLWQLFCSSHGKQMPWLPPFIFYGCCNSWHRTIHTDSGTAQEVTIPTTWEELYSPVSLRAQTGSKAVA